MKELLIWEQAYERSSVDLVIPILVMGVLLYGIFWVLMKKGITKRQKKIYQSWIFGMLLSLEITVIFAMTLYGRAIGTEREIHLVPFASYIEAFQPDNIVPLLQIIMNILMFVPLGILLPLNFTCFEKSKSVILIALVISGAIESIQGILSIGVFDVDDILGNVSGAAIGILCYRTLRRLKKRKC